MNSMTKTNEKRDVMRPWLSDFFDVDNLLPGNMLGSSFPSVNISDNDQSFRLEVIAPGFKKEDFKIDVDDDVLTISAEAKKEEDRKDDKKTYSRREYTYRSFTRSFRLPENAKDDSISATYEDGVLKVEIPKSKTEPHAKKEITVS